MAKSVITPPKPFITISGTYTVSSGYFSVVNPAIKVGDFVFVQIIRDDDGTWYGVDAVPRINANRYVNIYIRDMNGTAPNDGTKIQCDILVVKG